jgi:hypothetical protein
MSEINGRAKFLQSEYVLLNEKLSSLVIKNAPLIERLQVYREIRALHTKSRHRRGGY